MAIVNMNEFYTITYNMKGKFFVFVFEKDIRAKLVKKNVEFFLFYKD